MMNHSFKPGAQVVITDSKASHHIGKTVQIIRLLKPHESANLIMPAYEISSPVLDETYWTHHYGSDKLKLL